MEELKYNYIKHQILKLIGVDLNQYKAPQMQRRLAAYLIRSDYPNWPKLFRTLKDDPAKLNSFKNYLTINVSSFFRDPDKYKTLQTVILPELLNHRAALRVWSAGCSRGQEIYSLAMLLTQTDSHHRFSATDIDHDALQWAKAGGPYTANDITHVPANLLLHHFDTNNNEYWIKKELRHRVSFRYQDILSNPIAGKFDLIVCRNVVIYFQPEAKEKLYRQFYNALKPNGILFVGGTEIIPKATNIGFESAGVSFYRRRKK